MLFLSGMQALAVKKHVKTTPIETDVAVSAFAEYVETIPYLNEMAMAGLNKELDNHTTCLKNSTDKEAYISVHDLRYYVAQQRDSLQRYQGKAAMLIDDFLDQYATQGLEDRSACVEQMQAMVNDRLGLLETNLNLLERELNVKEEKAFLDLSDHDWMIIGICGGVFLLLLLIMLIVKASRKKGEVPVSYQPQAASSSTTSQDGGIVVRRKTATILKKQSLEGVIDNPDYMHIDMVDCCIESAVRRIYIKNSCVAELYEMYQGDQEAPEQAREYGCMVLGRWVHDAENNEYYVSLEEIVLPGDDAQFEEYELNFGGKIKLKVLEQLRKLRRDTNLQYDLTCWVHSHPGLGIFFSNSDSSVQMQLKHPTHPNFLTAIVVDTLTPGLQLGIFTFRRDTTINSKNDLKQLYSLEEWYQWAANSMNGGAGTAQPAVDASVKPAAPATAEATPAAEKPAFNSEDYFNTLAAAQRHDNSCYGIELSKNMVVDICMALTEHSNGIVGMIHGETCTSGPRTELLAEQLVDNELQASHPLIGCFIVAPHCSIPSIRKYVADRLDEMKFVLVYTPADGLLTSIPVLNRDLSTEIDYYGEQKLEDLKQWTKRGRS